MEQQHAQDDDKPTWAILNCEILGDGSAIRLTFTDAVFIFHAQWLLDAKCDTGPSRTAATAYCATPPVARAIHVHVNAALTRLEINWQDGSPSTFPAIWLRTYAPLVAKAALGEGPKGVEEPVGWLASTLTIPQVEYHDIFADTENRCSAVAEYVLDTLLMHPETGIIKVTGLPPPDMALERMKTNTLVTQVLKKLFGSVFQHSRRAVETTFNVASHHEEDSKRATGLPNYDTTQVLLPHVDHAHYQHPIQIQGWYCLEGESENTFVSGLRALQTLQAEAPDLYRPLVTSRMAVGRTVRYYDPPLRQATVDSPVTFHPGTTSPTPSVQRLRWHAHLTGSLVTAFDDFPAARAAHGKLHEIMRRDSHLLTVHLRPGDLYLWNNFTVLHGRERVLQIPRTGVGQTVPEQVVADRYRDLKVAALAEHLPEDWLVHMPPALLYQMREMVKPAC